MSAHPFHPVAEIFPIMTGTAFDELVADIKANGLRESIWRYEGKIIDGRNRYLACENAGIAPTFREWDGNGDLVKFVVSLNLHRRHLNESQRAMIGSKLATWPSSIRKNLEHKNLKDAHRIQRASDDSLTTDEAADLLNVGRSAVQLAKRVQREAAPEVISAVEAGELTLNMAEKIIAVPREKQKSEMQRRKMFKGKRNRRGGTSSEPKSHNGDGMSESEKPIVKVSIDTTNVEASARDLFAALDNEFIEKLVEELNGILARKKVAIARGMGPARKD